MLLSLLLLLQNAEAVDDIWPEIEFSEQTQKTPNDTAIIISIEDYAFVSDIAGANRNGQSWYRYFTEAKGIPTDNVRWLKDTNGSKEKIYTSALEIADKTSEEGNMWIVFIGHGAPSEDGSDGMLIGVDAQQDAQGLYGRSISQEKLLGLLEQGKQKQTIAIIDACFSGKSSGGELAPGLQPLIATQDLQTGTTTVLSAGRNDEFAGPLPGADRPAFSYLALGALQGWGDMDANGEVTASEIQSYSNKALQSTLLGRQQNPQVVGTADTPLGQGQNISPNFAEINLNMRTWEDAKEEELRRGNKLFSFKGNYKSLASFGIGFGLTAAVVVYSSKINDLEIQMDKNFNNENLDISYSKYLELQKDRQNTQKYRAGFAITAPLMVGLGFYFAL